jgi:dienelactone hydrolase
LKLESAVLGEKDDTPDKPFIRERWQLVWRPGDPIDLYVIKPRGVAKPPVVLFLYSFPQDTDRFKQDYWSLYATGGGFAAVGFVSAVTGQRLEYRRMNDDFFNQLPESLGATVHDVQMILNYLDSRGDLDMSRVGMFGQGSGGAIAILASSVEPRIKALDVLTPWGDWPTFLAKSTFIPSPERVDLNKPEFTATVAGLDPVQWFPKVKAKSVRIQDIRRDGHMPDDAQEAMEAAAPQTAEIDQFGDGAAFVPAAVNGKLFDWMRSQLKPDTQAQVPQGKSERVHYYPPKEPANPLGQTQ